MSDGRITNDLIAAANRLGDEGRAWLSDLPELIDTAVDAWDLELGPSFGGGSCAFVAPAGADTVLKITLPHREARFEADALRAWAGDGAVHVLAASDDGFSILVERCIPGTMLRDAELPADEQLHVGGRILAHLWQHGIPLDVPFETVADVCAEWAQGVRTRATACPLPIDAGLVELGASLLEALPATATRQVVVHGDFNPGNILRATREPWLAIDPKPMVGDPGYDVWPLAAQLGVPDGDERDALRHNFAVVADVAGVPAQRCLAWATARTVESALWHWSLGEDARAIDTMRMARILADLAGV